MIRVADQLGTGMIRDVGQFGTGMIRDVGQFGTGMIRDVGQFGTGMIRDVGQFGTGMIHDIGQSGTGMTCDIGQFGTGMTRDVGQFGTGMTRDIGQFGTGMIRVADQSGTGMIHTPRLQHRPLTPDRLGRHRDRPRRRPHRPSPNGGLRHHPAVIRVDRPILPRLAMHLATPLATPLAMHLADVSPVHAIRAVVPICKLAFAVRAGVVRQIRVVEIAWVERDIARSLRRAIEHHGAQRHRLRVSDEQHAIEAPAVSSAPFAALFTACARYRANSRASVTPLHRWADPRIASRA